VGLFFVVVLVPPFFVVVDGPGPDVVVEPSSTVSVPSFLPLGPAASSLGLAQAVAVAARVSSTARRGAARREAARGCTRRG
jgi:hypothetical protein